MLTDKSETVIIFKTVANSNDCNFNQFIELKLVPDDVVVKSIAFKETGSVTGLKVCSVNSDKLGGPLTIFPISNNAVNVEQPDTRIDLTGKHVSGLISFQLQQITAGRLDTITGAIAGDFMMVLQFRKFGYKETLKQGDQRIGYDEQKDFPKAKMI